MKRVFQNKVGFRYDAAHARAPYTLDGETWYNRGELLEVLCKAAFGLKAVKDANGAYNVTCDIPELSASVKSAKSSLTSRKLGETVADCVESYMADVVATRFLWVELDGDYLEVFEMTAAVFKKFANRFGKMDKGTVRFPTTSQLMRHWFSLNG